ncbi:MAG: carbohydrate porin [Verrucomicrobiota bacterium]
MKRFQQIWALLGLGLLVGVHVAQGEVEVPQGVATTNQQWSLHGQITSVSQGHGEFSSPYSGQNSMVTDEPIRTTYTATLFLGARLWHGGEAYVNPEIAGGRGLSGTVGAAGFPNGEATRVGDPAPSVYLARLFLRQTVALSDATEVVEPEKNQLGGQQATESLVLTLGKISVGDIFDQNSYSHDPRTQFLNWSLMANGAWDYPADTRGYTWGFAVEWNLPDWSVRAGTFTVPTEPNGGTFDHQLLQAQGNVVEVERDWRVGTHPGAARVLGYLNHANMGSYSDALSASTPPNLAATQSHRSKYGFGLNVEQELTPSLGVMGRLGWNDGRTETWMFTEIDRSASCGLVLKGNAWQRPQDQLGVGTALNGLSPDHHEFLGAGGYGFILGDGKIQYAPEWVIEGYYSIQVCSAFWISPGFTWIDRPADNKARGPVAIGTIRAHVEF